MEHALAELPLALFTTLAPIGAAAFIPLSIAFLTTNFTREQIKLIDKFTVIPLIIIILGFVASFFHLTQPLNAPNVVFGLGRSPLSNEIIVGSVFLVLAVVYWLAGFIGNLRGVARKIGVVIVALAALGFAVFTGMAYMMDTIVSWYTPFTVIEMVGYSILGGLLLGTMVLGFAGVLDEVVQTGFKGLLIAVAVIGGFLAIGGFVGHIIMVGGISSSFLQGSEVVSELLIFVIIAAVVMLLALILQIMSVLRGGKTGIAVLGFLLAIAGVFIARLVFYAMYLSVGL